MFWVFIIFLKHLWIQVKLASCVEKGEYKPNVPLVIKTNRVFCAFDFNTIFSRQTFKVLGCIKMADKEQSDTSFSSQASNPLSRKLNKILETRLDNDKVILLLHCIVTLSAKQLQQTKLCCDLRYFYNSSVMQVLVQFISVVFHRVLSVHCWLKYILCISFGYGKSLRAILSM